MDENLISLSLVNEARRLRMVEHVIKEIGEQRLPKQPIRIQPRVVKRASSRYERKRSVHLQVPVLELDVSFHEIIAVVSCRQGPLPEIPRLTAAKEIPALLTGSQTCGSQTGESPVREPTPDPLNPSSPSADISSSSSKPLFAKPSHTRERDRKTGRFKATRADVRDFPEVPGHL